MLNITRRSVKNKLSKNLDHNMIRTLAQHDYHSEETYSYNKGTLYNAKAENALIGKFVIDDRFQIIEANKQIYRLLGAEYGDFIGINILTLISPSQVHVLFNYIEIAFRNKIGAIFNLEFALNDNSPKTYRTECVLNESSGGNYFSVLIFDEVCVLYFLDNVFDLEETIRIKSYTLNEANAMDSFIEDNFELFNPPFQDRTTLFTYDINDDIKNLLFRDDFKFRWILFNITGMIINSRRSERIHISVTSLRQASHNKLEKLFFIISDDLDATYRNCAACKLDSIAHIDYCRIQEGQNRNLSIPVARNIINDMNGSIWTTPDFYTEKSIYFTIELHTTPAVPSRRQIC